MKYPPCKPALLTPEDREILVSLLLQEADELEYDRRFAVTAGMRARIHELRDLAARIAEARPPGGL